MAVRLVVRCGEIVRFRMHFLFGERSVLSVKTFVPQENNGLDECYLMQTPVCSTFPLLLRDMEKKKKKNLSLGNDSEQGGGGGRIEVELVKRGVWGAKYFRFCVGFSLSTAF